MKQINDRLSNRNVNDGKKGGKLNGFSIVSPTKSYLMIENKTKNKTNYVNLYKLE